MLQEEFEERTGIKDVNEYQLANAVYESATGFEKDEFCKVWKKADEATRKLMEDIVDTMQSRLNQAIQERDKQEEEAVAANRALDMLQQKDMVLHIPRTQFINGIEAMTNRGTYSHLAEKLRRRIVELAGEASDYPSSRIDNLARIKELKGQVTECEEQKEKWDGIVKSIYTHKEK